MLLVARSCVVLLDIRMPDVNGLKILQQLRRLRPPPTVATLTTFDSDKYIALALRLASTEVNRPDHSQRRTACDAT